MDLKEVDCDAGDWTYLAKTRGANGGLCKSGEDPRASLNANPLY